MRKILRTLALKLTRIRVDVWNRQAPHVVPGLEEGHIQVGKGGAGQVESPGGGEGIVVDAVASVRVVVDGVPAKFVWDDHGC